MAKGLKQLKAERGKIGIALQDTQDHLGAITKELLPFFSARKAIRFELSELGLPASGEGQARRRELFQKLDALQFACDYCTDPDHCADRLTDQCRSVGRLCREKERLEARSKAYGRELLTLERLIKEAETKEIKKNGEQRSLL